MQRDARTIRDLQAQPEAHLARCRALLVDTAIALVIDTRLVPAARDILLARLAVASLDLGGITHDDPVFVVRAAVDRVVDAQAKPGRWDLHNEADHQLRRALRGFFLARSDKTQALIAGTA
jgi:hypothetical protein